MNSLGQGYGPIIVVIVATFIAIGVFRVVAPKRVKFTRSLFAMSLSIAVFGLIMVWLVKT